MRAVDVPVYDFATHRRSQQTRRVDPADVVIIEGILVLHMPEVSLHQNVDDAAHMQQNRTTTCWCELVRYKVYSLCQQRGPYGECLHADIGHAAYAHFCGHRR